MKTKRLIRFSTSVHFFPSHSLYPLSVGNSRFFLNGFGFCSTLLPQMKTQTSPDVENAVAPSFGAAFSPLFSSEHWATFPSLLKNTVSTADTLALVPACRRKDLSCSNMAPLHTAPCLQAIHCSRESASRRRCQPTSTKRRMCSGVLQGLFILLAIKLPLLQRFTIHSQSGIFFFFFCP